MINALRRPEDRRWYNVALGALVLCAWGALAIWGASPYAGLLDHRELSDGPFHPGRLAVFAVGWTLMTVAMMLPSSLPLLTLYRRFVRDRDDGPRLLTLLVVAYLAVWGWFGVVAYAADGLLHAAVLAMPLFGARAEALAAILLLVAGIYQFTPLKEACLERCRSPYSFLVQYWSGKRPARDTLRLGIRHGLFCLGCCWTLMLLMFAIGGANLGWMLALGALMAAERATRWGRRLTRPVGAALAAWGILVLAGLVGFPAS